MTDYCEDCNGPCHAKTRLQLVFNSYAYDLWMALPFALAFSRFGYALLPFVGAYAFTCSCPAKVLDQVEDV